jgi:hypothetical protein
VETIVGPGCPCTVVLPLCDHSLSAGYPALHSRLQGKPRLRGGAECTGRVAGPHSNYSITAP